MTALHYTEDEVIFLVRGVGDEYLVTLHQNADLFFAIECTCEDSSFRSAELRCKHICHVLLALGADKEDVSDPDYEPSQNELNELLMYAPMIVQGLEVSEDPDAESEWR